MNEAPTIPKEVSYDYIIPSSFGLSGDMPKEANIIMQTRSIRTSVTITPELVKELDKVKKSLFYNKSHAEMYRYLIRCGLDRADSLSNQNITTYTTFKSDRNE